jgi:NAD(P)-dependent dehydrogenase (short-subunit alcohol dehydrogenase family)
MGPSAEHTNRSALVTGAAGGIGRAIAERLVAVTAPLLGITRSSGSSPWTSM